MSRRISIHRDLERYLDDLCDAVDDVIDDMREHSEPTIRRIRLDRDAAYKLAALVFETFVLEDDMPESDAIDEAAEITINSAVYIVLKRERELDQIPEGLEFDLRDDHDEFEKIVDTAGGRSRRNRRDNGRERDRDNRRGRDERRSGRRERGQDADSDRSRRRRDERQKEEGTDNSREARAARRSESSDKQYKRNNDRQRDSVVETAKQNVDENKLTRLTKAVFLSQKGLAYSQGFSAPTYYLGSQIPYLKNGQVEIMEIEDMEWERHRTDLYLKVRSSIQPSINVRKEAFERSIEARRLNIDQIINGLTESGNVLIQDSKVHLNNVSVQVDNSKWYGAGSGLSMLRGAYNEQVMSNELRRAENDPIQNKPVFSLKSPAVATIRRYPNWVINKDLHALMVRLINLESLSDLMPLLIEISNTASPEQWVYIHDLITRSFSEAMRISIGTNAYLESIVAEWNSFAQWIQNHEKGAYTLWFNSNLKRLFSRAFIISTNDEESAHSLVDGSDEKFASLHYISRIIYIPIESEHLGLASPTKLGRVLESTTADLYRLLSEFVETQFYEHLVVTKSDESFYAYSKFGVVNSKPEIYVGELV